MKILLASGLLWLLITGCNSAQQQENAESLKQQQQEVVQDIREPLEKAQAVEQMLMDQAEQRKQQADGL